MTSYDLRGRAIVAAARRAPAPLARKLLREAAKIVATLERQGQPPAAPLARMIEAAVLHQRGDAEGALGALRSAATGFEAAHMALHAQAAHRRIGALQGGDEGRARLESADAWMRSQRVADPARLAGMLAPGFTSSR